MRKKDDKDDTPSGIKKLLQRVGERKSQDMERGLEKSSLLFPLIRHEVSKDDLRGDPKKLGRISLAPFDPYTPEAEQKLARYFLKHFQKWLLGKRLPQKRVRPKHERDKSLASDTPEKVVVDGKQVVHRLMDDLVFKKTENIGNDKQFAKKDKTIRKRLIQAKWRYSNPESSSKTS